MGFGGGGATGGAEALVKGEMPNNTSANSNAGANNLRILFL